MDGLSLRALRPLTIERLPCLSLQTTEYRPFLRDEFLIQYDAMLSCDAMRKNIPTQTKRYFFFSLFSMLRYHAHDDHMGRQRLIYFYTFFSGFHLPRPMGFYITEQIRLDMHSFFFFSFAGREIAIG
jgi:hypothetical protein